MKIMNIKFRKTKKVYPFLINDEKNYKKGDHVIVDTIRGEQIGIVLGTTDKRLEEDNEDRDEVKIREVKRKLSDSEVEKLKDLDKKADEAYFKCKKIVKRILPEMNLVIGEYTFDESKLIFYFTAENRLDFRELVKEVNKTFKKRVEFYQIKSNDEGRILCAFGKYGREIYW
jgi:stage 0 sporulation protein yaaT